MAVISGLNALDELKVRMASVLRNDSELIDYYGEAALRLHRSHPFCRFVEALAEAEMMKKLSSEDAHSWLTMQQVIQLPGLKRDNFRRVAQLEDLLKCHLIQICSGGPRGLWEYEQIRSTDAGLALVKLLRTGVDSVIVFVSDGRSIAASSIRIGW